MTTAHDLAEQYPRAARWTRHRGADRIVADFHRLFYDTDRYASVTWWGHECWKYPTDLLIYAELVAEVRPALIIETGTYRGGSSLFFAHLLELAAGSGRVVSIDIHDDTDIGPDPRGQYRPTHPRLQYVKGSSTAPEVVARVMDEHAEAIAAGPVMLILDSDHTERHVRDELDVWADVATLIVVEDTNLGHEVLPGWGPGPREAVEGWLPGHPGWFQDRRCERLLLTCAPGGFLRRRT